MLTHNVTVLTGDSVSGKAYAVELIEDWAHRNNHPIWLVRSQIELYNRMLEKNSIIIIDRADILDIESDILHTNSNQYIVVTRDWNNLMPADIKHLAWHGFVIEEETV